MSPSRNFGRESVKGKDPTPAEGAELQGPQQPIEPGVELTEPKPPEVPARARPKRFHGSVRVDALWLGRDVGLIQDEVVQRLAALVISFTLRSVGSGTPPVCRTLRFDSASFEEE